MDEQTFMTITVRTVDSKTNMETNMRTLSFDCTDYRLDQFLTKFETALIAVGVNIRRGDLGLRDADVE